MAASSNLITDVLYDPSTYIEIKGGGTFISEKAYIPGSQNIRVLSKTIIKHNVVMRGDIAKIRIGRNCVIKENAVIRPPCKLFDGGFAFFPVMIGDYVMVGENSVVEAASVGMCVTIGRDCIVSKNCILYDCCVIEDGAIVPPDTVVPPFGVVRGIPGRLVGEQPESAVTIAKQACDNYYRHFKSTKGLGVSVAEGQAISTGGAATTKA